MRGIQVVGESLDASNNSDCEELGRVRLAGGCVLMIY